MKNVIGKFVGRTFNIVLEYVFFLFFLAGSHLLGYVYFLDCRIDCDFGDLSPQTYQILIFFLVAIFIAPVYLILEYIWNFIYLRSLNYSGNTSNYIAASLLGFFFNENFQYSKFLLEALDSLEVLFLPILYLLLFAYIGLITTARHFWCVWRGKVSSS